MNIDDLLKQIKNIIKPLQDGQQQLDKRLGNLENGQAHIATLAEALAAGQKDLVTKKELRDLETSLKLELALKADKADILDLKSDLMKRIKVHERRISSLEDELDIPHPQKN